LTQDQEIVPVVIELDTLSPQEVYKLMISLIVPRPIAWVTTVNPEGVVNAAPYSYFGGVTSSPPIISVSVARRKGTLKDTARNIEATGEFVVNLVSEESAELMNRTATEYPYGVSEVEELGLELASSETVKVPRLAASPAALECRLLEMIPIGEPPVAHILGGVQAVLLREGIAWDHATGIHPDDLQPVGRLGHNRYARISDIFEMDRIPYPLPE
jgi:flavin reductase (DIM6/NTAB) family NADH-FMN oxidoreductase RutF